MSLATSLAVRLMELAPAAHPAIDDPRYAQIFNHPDYLNGSADYRRSVRQKSSQYRYDYETKENTFETFFPDAVSFRSSFRGARMLDLGCLTGGRTAAWTEIYQPSESHGFDIKEVYIEAAREFAEQMGHPSKFKVGFAEDMPYDDDFFDVVATFDVLEHVQDVEKAMSESLRVLRPGGRLYAVFPPYYNPFAAHLGLATRMHGLGLLFSGEVLAEAHHEVIRRRGPEHDWYNDPPELPDYYKAPFLNGITVARFREIVESQGWSIESWPVKPILTQGRRSRAAHFKAIASAVRPLASVPRLEEVFVGSVTVVLRNPE